MHRIPVLFGAVLLIAAPLAPGDIPAFFGRLALQSELEDFAGTVQGLSVQQIHLAASRRAVVVEGLVLRRAGFTMRIGRLALRLPRPEASGSNLAFTQAAAAADSGTPESGKESVAADNVSIDTGTLHASIKHMSFEGTKLGKADINALLDPHAATPIAERLAKISAAHVAIPELVIETKQQPPEALANKIGPPAAPQDEKIVLHDIAMNNVVQGHAGTVSAGSADTLQHSPGAEEVQGTFGPIHATGLDLVQIARLLTPTGDKISRDRLCDSLDIDSGKLSAPGAKAELLLAAIKVKDIAPGYSKASATASNPDASGKSDSAFSQVLHALDIGSLEFTSLHFTKKSGSPWSAGIRHGYLAGIKSGQIGDAGFENTGITTANATVAIGRLAWHGLTLQAPMKFLGMTTPDAKPPAASLPGQQRISADAIAVLLTTVDPSTARSPDQFQIRHAELASSALVDGVPTRLTASIEHFTCDMRNVNDHNPDVAALGYDRLDLSSKLAMHLDNDNSEFALDGLSLSGAGMGSLQISGFMDHLTKGLVSSDPIESKAALLKVLLHHFEIRVQNNGLFERLVAAEAKRTNSSPNAVRAQILDWVTGNLPELLSNSRDGDLITAALAKFITNPGNLQLSILAPQGISAADVISAADPRQLVQRIKIEVSANQ